MGTVIKTKKLPFTVKKCSRNSYIVKIKVSRSSQLNHSFLLSGDRHHDSTHCNRRLEKKHLDEVKERNAGIIDVGDLFCVMQSRNDRRGSKSGVRAEYQGSDYFDRVVKEAINFYEPYKDHFVVIGEGNHESAVRNHHEFDLTNRLCESLGIYRTGYTGFVRFQVDFGNKRESLLLYHDHGSGGAAPVTKGVIQTNRRTNRVADADVFLSGHIHQAWYMENVMSTANTNGTVGLRTQYHIQTPTYKDAYSDGYQGWEKEKGMAPSPLGAWWMRMYVCNGKLKVSFERAQ